MRLQVFDLGLFVSTVPNVVISLYVTIRTSVKMCSLTEPLLALTLTNHHDLDVGIGYVNTGGT